MGEVVEGDDDGEGGMPAQAEPRHRRHHLRNQGTRSQRCLELQAGSRYLPRTARKSSTAAAAPTILGKSRKCRDGSVTTACLLRQPGHQSQLVELRRHGHEATKPEQRVPGLVVGQAVLPAAHACTQKAGEDARAVCVCRCV